MKFKEDVYLKDFKEYLDKANSPDYHYASEEIEPIDVWKSLGSLETSARDAAIKYLMRFGKKDGKNIKDLYKAMHMILYMIHSLDKNENLKSHIEALENL